MRKICILFIVLCLGDLISTWLGVYYLGSIEQNILYNLETFRGNIFLLISNIVYIPLLIYIFVSFYPNKRLISLINKMKEYNKYGGTVKYPSNKIYKKVRLSYEWRISYITVFLSLCLVKFSCVVNNLSVLFFKKSIVSLVWYLGIDSTINSRVIVYSFGFVLYSVGFLFFYLVVSNYFIRSTKKLKFIYGG